MSLSGVKIFVTGTMVHRQSAASTSSDNLWNGKILDPNPSPTESKPSFSPGHDTWLQWPFKVWAATDYKTGRGNNWGILSQRNGICNGISFLEMGEHHSWETQEV
jgi:hypothetical protein